MLCVLIIYFHVAVCSEEEGCWNLGLQGLWKGQSRRCLHLEVIILTWISFFFPLYFWTLTSKWLIAVFVILTALLVLWPWGAPFGGLEIKLKVEQQSAYSIMFLNVCTFRKFYFKNICSFYFLTPSSLMQWKLLEVFLLNWDLHFSAVVKLVFGNIRTVKLCFHGFECWVSVSNVDLVSPESNSLSIALKWDIRITNGGASLFLFIQQQ